MMNFKQNLKRLRGRAEDVPIWQRFKRNASISVAGSGLSLAIRLGQTALLTKVLEIEDYGRVLIVLNLFVFLESFFGWRLNDVMFRFFPLLKEQGDQAALKGLLLFCGSLALLSGLLIYGGVFFLSPSLGHRLYPSLDLATLFRIFGCTVLLTSFRGIYEPILRIHNRFASVVAPQVLGSLITLIILCVYFATGAFSQFKTRSQSLKVVIAAFAVGALVQSGPPFFQAWRLVQSSLAGVSIKKALAALAEIRRELLGCFIYSNLSGYLKFAISPGDIFFLGLFSTPAQVALYGIAKQLTAPLALLETNIQTAITPEITRLVAKRKYEQLKRLVGRYTTSTLALSSFLFLGSLLLGRILIMRWAGAEYLPALPVFYVVSVAAWLLVIFILFRPLAVSLDLLKWHNLALLMSGALVVAFIAAGDLNALTMACLQLVEVAILRAGFSLLVWKRLNRLETEQAFAN